ncbi:hypothetical protein BO94DRAFT_590305 [Aspergillus sclerotioniger CBS 115572]|uniref:Uncharacterized protein n=1 Tax=Aspergillus sclerotioniger CBS 115572 TaxID=1450535 RepID=A0A317V8K7_9EURO|nr:hypothetical protein BO94DRAFT_590305 [Aspergillus sclerotioniger CBS 115572]PWY70395.1 hypothetical protein BO94DRAFT_590305 [Aspergillus sclerotioniger CBS 115572]
MAQAIVHRYLSCDSYNRIEVWIAQTNAELASSRPVPTFKHPSPQPSRFPRFSRTHLAHVQSKHRPPDFITRGTNQEDLESNSVTVKEERLDRESPTVCGFLLNMNPDITTEKSQEQLLGRESRPRPSKLGWFEQSVASLATDLASTSYTSNKDHHGYERRPRHRTKNDRYEYKNKKVGGRNYRVSKRVKRPTNDTFHASNVPCDRLTLNHRGIQGIFQKGKASAPVKSRTSGPMPDLFGFDTPMAAWNLHPAPRLGFSESEFLLGKSVSDRISSSRTTCELDEESDSAEYPTTSAPKHSNAVANTPSTTRGYYPPRSWENVNLTSELKGKDGVLALDFSSDRALELHPKKLLGYYLNPPETVGTPSKPNISIDNNQQCYSRLEEGEEFQKRKFPSLSSGSKRSTAKLPRSAKKVDAIEKERWMPEQLATSLLRDDISLEQSGLPNADLDWQPVSAFDNCSSFVAATKDFDDGMILDGGVHGDKQTSKVRIGSDSWISSSMVEISLFGEPLDYLGHEATKATGELDYEIVDSTMAPEVMDCSDMEALMDMEECVTNITHDTDKDYMDTASNMIAASSVTCDTSTSGIEERSEPWLESRVRRSPGPIRIGNEDLNMDIFDGFGRFWQRQRYY